MAKKNEILLSIALEGDQDVKSKLKAVGAEGKQSLADIEKQAGKAGEGFGRRFAESAAAPVSKLREAIAPILEGAGLGQLGAGLASGGLLSRLFGVAGPAAAVAALAGVAVRLAKVREETEKTEASLTGLGGSKDIGGKVNASAKKLGVDPKSVEGDVADFLATRRRALADQSRGISHPPGFVPPENQAALPQIFQGGKLVSGAPATEDQFLASREALISGARLDKKSPGEAQGPVSQLLKGINSGGLTGDLVRQFGAPGALPKDADLLARVLGPVVSRGFGNSEEFAKFLDKNGPIGADKVFGRLSKEAPQIAKDTAGERGVSESFDALGASAKRLEKTFADIAGGPIGKSLAKDIDKVTGGVGAVSGSIESNKGLIETGTNIGVKAGQFNPIPIPGSGIFTGVAGGLAGGVAGAAIGGIGDLTDAAAKRSSIFDFILKAFGNPGAISGNNPEPLPDITTAKPPVTREQLETTKIPSPLDGVSEKSLLLTSPLLGAAKLLPELFGLREPPPPQPQPPEGPSAQQPVPVQPVPPAGQQSAGPSLLEGISAAINSLNQQNLKVDTPASGIGIRGSLEDPSQNVANSVKDAGALLASAIAEVAANIKNGAAPTVKVAAAAGGGMIRWMDGGGGVSGPGTTTSDSIPAMLSDKEYVIKAESARKIGREHLDWLNAGRPGYADGGNVAAGVTKLSAGNHQISYDPSTGGAYVDGVLRLPGDPILQDPFVQAAIQRSKADAGASSQKKHKSDFTGVFGGHVFDTPGSYAAGGAVGGLSAFGSAVSRAFGGRSISIPGFADGGMAEVGGLGGLSPVVSDLSSSSPWSDMPHLGSMDLTSDHGKGRVIGPEDTLKHMVQNARDAAMVQTGPRPSWAYGSDR